MEPRLLLSGELHADPALPPHGSLIHTSSVTAGFSTPGESDTYTIDLDAGQTLTLGLKPNDSSILGRIDVRDSGNNLLASVQATSPGDRVFLQTLPIGALDTYTIVATSIEGTGEYDASFWLNSLLETENLGGETNDEQSSAIDLSPSSIALPNGADRLAVVGRADDGAYDFYFFDLSDGQAATIGLTATEMGAPEGSLFLELLDDSGNLLTLGQDGWGNVDEAIHGFVAPQAGTYFVRVSGEAGREYTLIVTRGADFDLEPNSRPEEAKDISGTGVILGSLGSSGAGSINVAVVSSGYPDYDGGLWGIVNQLNDDTYFDFNATLISPSEADTVEELQVYDVVVIGGTGYDWNQFSVFAGALLSYVQGGGGLVTTGWGIYASSGLVEDVRNAFDAAVPVNTIGGYSYYYDMEISPVGSHPIVDGVNSFSVPAYIEFPWLEPRVDGWASTLAIISVEIEIPVAAAGYVGAGRSVYLGPIYAADYAPGELRNADADRLLEQAVAWAARGGADRADNYLVQVQNGDTLTITTATPGDGTGEPVNNLDPLLELFAPDGTLVASNSNGAGDGRNARIFEYTAEQTGLYRVKIFAESGSGEYTLLVEGATGTQQPFAVTASNPLNGSFLNVYPNTFTVDFSAPLLLTSLDAGDLLINGVPADSVTVIDADTLEFSIASMNTGEGPYTVTIEAGSLASISGQMISPFSATFVYDATAPVVTECSLFEGAVVAPGDLTVLVVFSEAMATAGLGAEDVILVNHTTGVFFAAADGDYDEGTLTATVSFAGLTEGVYTLIFWSGFDAFRDITGNLLDGGPSFPLPSGGGFAGDHFVVNFQVDATTASFPVPLILVDPEGSLIYRGSATGLFNFPSDTDSFTIDLDAGQTLSLGLLVNSPSIVGRIEVYSPDSVLLGSAVSPSAGGIAAIQTLPVSTAGTYTISLTSLSGSGTYYLALYVNTLLGPPPAATGLPAEGDLTVTSPYNVRFNRGANSLNHAVGDLQVFGAMISPYGTGTTATATQGETIYALNFSPSQLFPSEYNKVIPFDGTLTGAWSINAMRGEESVTVMTTAILNPQLLPFVENLQVIGSGPAPTVSWTLPDFTGFDVDALRVRVYDDVTNTMVFRSSTLATTTTEYTIPEPLLLPGGRYVFAVDIDDFEGGWVENRSRTHTQTPYVTAWDMNSSAISLGSVATRLAATGTMRGGQALYSFSLAEAQSATLVLTDTNYSGFSLTLEDATGTVIAIGATGARNLDESISNFLAPVTGTYYARITGPDNQAYTLVVTRNSDFDLELGDQPVNAQDITLTKTVLGGLGGGATGFIGGGATGSTSLGVTLYDATGYRWDIQGNGNISDGTSDAYDGGMHHTGFPGFASAQTEEGGREIVIGPATIGGVQVTRKIYIPGDQSFARFLEIVYNPGVSSVNYTVPIYTNLGSDGDEPFVMTSSGDSTVTTLDNWLITDDSPSGSSGGDPVVTHVVAGQDGRIRPATFTKGSGEVNYSYNLTLAPGETKIIMHFASQAPNQATALARASQLANLELNALSGMSQAERSAVVNFPGMDFDQYLFAATTGNNLVITTSTPGDGAGEPVNNLDPRLVLYRPDGTVAMINDNGGADGRNARIEFTADQTGRYRIEVVSVSASPGAYVLSVVGATGADQPFLVTGSSISDGQILMVQPASVDIDFSDSLLLTSVQAGDLSVNGNQALAVTVIDHNTLRFNITGLVTTEGAYTLSIPGGSLLDLQGTSNVAFTRGFIYDATLPTVANSSVSEGQILTPGAQTFVFTISEDIAASGLGAEDVLLTNAATGQSFTPGSFDYNAGTDQVTVQYASLPEGAYTLTLISGAAAFRDLAGNALNGDTSTPGPDNYLLRFSVDAPTASLPAMTPMNPFGSLIYQAEVPNRAFHGTGDADWFTVSLDAGQTFTLAAVPTFGSALMALELFAPDGSSLGVAEATLAGQSVLLQTIPVSVAGTYQIEVRSLEGIGRYSLKTLLNAAVENEMVFGTGNDTLATAQDLTSSFIITGSDRAAVVGQRVAGSEPADWYFIHLTSGQKASFGLTPEGSFSASNLSLELYNEAGTLLTAGTDQAANVDEVILDFVAPAEGDYYLRVSGGAPGIYTLVVTRDQAFGVEPLNSSAIQDISQTYEVLGALGGAGVGGGRIAVVASPHSSYNDGLQGIVNQLNDDTYFNFTAILITPSQADTLEELKQYDAVVIGGARYSSNEFSIYASALRAYVEAGGGLITTGWGIYSAQGLTGQARIDFDAVVPVNVSGSSDSYVYQTVFIPVGSHPILDGVPSFNTGTYTQYPTGSPQVDAGATLLGTTSGYVAAAAAQIGMGRSVYLGPIYAGYHSGWNTAALRTGAADRLLEQAVAWASTDVDEYLVQVNAGDSLVITTSTPGDGSGEPANLLDPKIELHDPSGALVASDLDSGPDGRNVLLNYTALATGAYKIKVMREEGSGQGEYVLKVAGATGSANAAPQVVATTPVENRRLSVSPTSLTLDLSEAIRADSVQTGDLTIDGGASVTGVEIVDGDTVKFLVSVPNVEGTYTYTLAAGGITDLLGQGSLVHSGSFILDMTPPRVVSQTPEVQSISPFNTWSVTFSEALNPATIQTSDFVLRNPSNSGIGISTATLSQDGLTVALTFSGQSIKGNYTLTVGTDIFDVAGNRMDQDPATGGNQTYIGTVQVAAPDLQPVSISVTPTVEAPLGSAVSVTWTVRNIGNDAARTSTWYDRIYISTNANASISGDTQLNYFTLNVSPLTGNGGEYSMTQNVTLPLNDSFNAGTYYIKVWADGYSNQPENNENNNILASAAFTTAVPALPDLVVNNVTAPAIVEAGKNAQITWTVQNQGGAVTTGSGWYDRIVLSGDTVFGNGDDVYLTEHWYSGSLNAGGSADRSINVTVPTNRTGLWYVLVKADHYNHIYERLANENNNVGVSAAQMNVVVATEDLTVTGITVNGVTDVSTPVSGVFGSAINLGWTVQNVGTGPTMTNWYDDVYFSRDQIAGNSDDVRLTYVYSSDVTPLASGVNYTRSVENVSLPLSTSWSPGNYYLIFRTDSYGHEPEANENNNQMVRTISLTLPPVADLTVSNVQVPANAYAGDTVQMRWTLTNNGTAAAFNFYDRLYLNNDSELDGSYSRYLTEFYFNDTLDPEESVEVVRDVTLPVNLPGDWYVIIGSDIYNHIYEHQYENNNTAVSGLIRAPWGPMPDLVVTNISAPQDIVLNPTGYTPVPVSWTITNQGNASATNWYDYVSLSDNNSVGGDQGWANFYFEGTINPGQSITRTQNINFSYDQARTCWLVVQTDSNNQHYEVTVADPRSNVIAEQNNTAIDDRSLRVIFPPLPNLQVTGVTPPETPFSGQETIVSWVVTNTGTGPTSAPNWYDAVYLSLDNVYDGTDTHLGNVLNPSYLGTDPSNKSYTNSLTVTIPRGISGDYYFLVKTDIYNHVFENVNEGDNLGVSASTEVTLTQPPDLQVVRYDDNTGDYVSSVVAPGGYSGGLMDITWTVTNRGPGGTREGGWYDRIYMSEDNTLGGDRELGVFWHSGILPAGDSYTRTESVRLPIGIPADGVPRDYYFFVVTDANNHVYEHSSVYEANNSNSDPGRVSLTPPPDLEPDLFAIPVTAQAGRVLTFNYGVTNWGSTPTPNSYWVDGFWLSTDNQLDGSDTFMGDRGHSGALDVGQAYTGSFSYTLPYGLTGSYYVIMRTDRYNQVFEGLDQPPSYLPEANNVRASAGMVTVASNPADLVVDAFTSDATGEAGKQINVSWTVRNAGTGDSVVSNWTDRIIASRNGELGDGDDVELGSVGHTGVLPVSGSYTVSTLLSLPFSFYQDYVLFVKTDVYNNVYESNNDNNASSGRALTVSRETPDLQVVSVTAPAEGTAGSSIVIGWRVENLGVNTTNSNYWYDDVWLSTNQILDGSDIRIGTYFRSNPLTPAQGYNGAGTYAVPTSVAAGNYFVLVRTDRDNQVLETSENNNVRSSETTVAIAAATVLMPDLVVESVDAPSDAYSGQPFELTWTVRNTGVDPTPGRNWYDSVYLSRDMNFDRHSDLYLGYRYRTDVLGADDAYTVTQAFTVPGGQTGLFYVFVVTDSGNHITEANDSNNIGLDSGVMSVSLAPPANLVAGLVTIPVNGVPGQNADITYSVSNAIGANSISGGWKDSLYLSSDTTWDVNDTYFGAANIYYSPLAGGESYSRTVTAPLPGVNPGNYYLIVRSDILNQVIETSESDNLSASLVHMNIDAEILALGGSDTFTLGNNQSVYYRLQTVTGDTVRVSLDSVGTNIANEIYIKFGSMPSRAQYDFASVESYTPDPETLIPETEAGTYYILVYGSSVSGTPQATISAQVIPFSITGVWASKVGNAGESTLEIRGAKFAEATDFFLRSPDNVLYEARDVKFEDASRVYATFDLYNAGIGLYDVLAVQANASSTFLSDCVTVIVGSGADVYASIDGPRQVAVNRLNLFTLQYTNFGDADTMAPLLLMSSRTATPLGFSSGDMRTVPLQILGASLDGPMDVLRPGARYSQSVLFRSPDGDSLLDIRTSIIMPADGREIGAEGWQSIEAAIRPAGITDEQWNPWWARFKPSIGTTWGSYVQVINRMMMNLSEEGRPIRDVRELFSRQLAVNPSWLASVSISGAVLNSAGSAPMADVEVSVYRLDASGHMVLGGVATTNASGIYSIAGLQDGLYDVYLTNTQFDMDRDGFADNYTPNITIVGTSNVTDQTLYAFTTAAVSDLTPQDIEPLLITDSAGVSHLIWDRGGVLYHAYYLSGQWIDGQAISDHKVTHYSAAASGNLLNGSNPGLIVVWNEGQGNSSEIWYSVGRAKVGGGYEWSDAVRVTNDTVADIGPEVAVTSTGNAVITYTKKNQDIQDDTDLYYSLVEINSGALVFTVAAEDMLGLLTSGLSELEPSDMSIAFSWSKDFDSGPLFGFQAKAGIKVAGTISQSGCAVTAGLGGQGSLEVTVPDLGAVTGSLGGALNAYWSVDYSKYPDCEWKFDNAQLDANGEVGFKWENAVYTIVGFVPVLKPVGVALKKAQDLVSKYTPLTIEHGALIGPLGFEAKNLRWTKIPPIPIYTGPDEVDSLAIYFKIGLYGNLKQKGVSDAELSLSGLIGGKLNIIKKPADPRLQFTYEAGLVAKIWGFEFFSFSLSGAYPSEADMFALDNPLFEQGLTYNPAGSVGTGNDYGDSVLASIGGDLWRDTSMSLATDGAGTVFGVWAKDMDPYGTEIGSKLYVADFNGATWNTPVEVAGSLGFNNDAVVGVDGDGDRLMVWSWASTAGIDPDTITIEELQAVRDGADLVFSVNSGSGWSAPQLLITTTGADSKVTMARDASGNLIIAWTYYDSESSGYLMSAVWDGTTDSWRSPVQVVSGVVASPEMGMVGGAPTLFWNEDVGVIDGQFVIRYATLGGSGWSTAELFAPIMLASASVTVSSAGTTAGSNVPFSPSGFLQFAIPDDCCKCDPAKIKKITEAAPSCRPGGGSETTFDYKECIEKTIVYEPCSVRPRDPNDILGPAGFGEERWVTAKEVMPYTIRFENAADASAPAQEVIITQTLDADLDFRTFRVDDFGWGDFRVALDADRPNYSKTLDFKDTLGFNVKVDVNINVATGFATWTFTTIDPATGEKPADASIGFLPVNDTVYNPEDHTIVLVEGTHRGEGFVSYTVKAKNTAVTGDKIDAEAKIIFDTQEPIDTPAIFNTIDAGVPISSVTVFDPAITQEPQFLVSWTGLDDEGGSAIRDYTIYAAVDGSAFSIWLLNTTLTESFFVGAAGHSYAFYSTARDNAGNVEAAPGSADATLVVEGFGSLSGIVFADMNGNQAYNAPGDAGLGGWTVFLDMNGNGGLDQGEMSVTSATDGTYIFENLLPGVYTVRNIVQSGWMSTTGSKQANVAAGAPVVNVHLGNFELVGISGIVFHDLNNSGVRNDGEPGLGGWRVFLDADADGILDDGEQYSDSASDGSYTITGAGPGQVTIGELMEGGWIRSTPAITQILTSGTSLIFNVGNVKLASLSGMKFDDLDGDGAYDEGEPGISGWTIFLDSNANGRLDSEISTQTDANGRYTFEGLLPGFYTVAEVQKTGWVQTSPLGTGTDALGTLSTSDSRLPMEIMGFG